MNEIRKEDLISVENPDSEALQAFLAEQNISLKPNELLKIREMLERDPTRVELHIFNVMWSEHCSYKSSKALLKKHLPTEAPHVVLGPGEDAGIVRFHEKDGKHYCLVLAHESHNHPSQVLPVEGAATGIGGIVRDVYCMGADVIGVMDPLRFGDPDGPSGKRVKEIVRGVVDGIAQYGNALGVPNYGGDTYFDGRFDDNCLVNVVALGIVEEDDIIRSRAPAEARREPHDIVLIGKPTDASGFGGAAFASVRLSGDQTEERQEAVQIPDPFLKRVLTEATKVVLAEAKRRGVPIGFKDLGAGGISCAVSEMAQAGRVGATVDLDRVNTASQSFLPEVVACSETQERYAMIVPRSFTETVRRVYNDDFELPHLYPGSGAYVIGSTTLDRRFRLISAGDIICDADVDVITTGIEYQRPARGRERSAETGEVTRPPVSLADTLVELLSSYNVSDKSILYRHYDSEVQGHAVLRPGEADAAVAVVLPGEGVAVAAGIGGNPRIGPVDPYLGGVWAVVEAVRNVACVGGRPLAITDCLNYGDPEDPEVFWEFSEGVRGVGDACKGLRVAGDSGHSIPVISGNVSFYNQSGSGRPIAPSPIVACAGRVRDASVSRGLGFKKPGSHVVLLGLVHDRIGGSEYADRFLAGHTFEPPVIDLARETALIQTLIEAVEERLVLAAHDITHGGLAVAVAEMVIESAPFQIGCDIELSVRAAGGSDPARQLFSEYGGVIVEVPADLWERFRERLDRNRVEWTELGRTHERPVLGVVVAGESFEVSVEALRSSHRGGKVNPLFA
jgi:phosphoribosylformylglycinamidine synthase